MVRRASQPVLIGTVSAKLESQGTEFILAIDGDTTRVWMLEGQAELSNGEVSLALTRGQSGIAESGKKTRRLLEVTPSDAVKWSVYYPPIIDYRTMVAGMPATVQEALTRFRQDDIDGTFQLLESVPASQRTVCYHNLKVGLLLSVGRLDEALPVLEQALQTAPSDGIALALKVIVQVVHNQRYDALRLAQRAVGQAPESPVPLIALSYAYQSLFDIEQARSSVQQATKLAPDDALAWARMAELWLAGGYRKEALEGA